ncbi:MAG TPA: Stp1/IreP family PP2C-type Ser/Thr phosphatase [candidate division Zixibacteria bacterium]|nr:Stp1/IreP family PP2C-type Ser/Thr phosphatase [candidate division Zixibacteria bacterium]MDD4916341.1 Stp1/IreP family PP2C-type Ser/Thr phosphatase [candidate division Zixibacteria bacterium]MDM7971857.1 Stp1/IreP family PP2C-type Ser/Thr phosphatase [candidate division Zixibacteria bacterium]HOD66369.1 Stp1/IreP family PP2C-type Ser/Thr phosphatase [candidate division Zixibacteria bacterium]HOZ08814.1 Stp1/IreP family PP2C-type Ser/Thr phosphatase [candidate division Zixibacteria bacteriu
MALVIQAVGKTDVGLVRKGNEDNLYLDDRNHLYVVCDGMGGHQAGEVASMSAVTTLETVHNQLRREILGDERLSPGRALPDETNLLLRAIRLANREIYGKAAANSSMAGMGTTIVAIAFEHDLAGIAHVGDSRAYRLEARRLVPLTADHSWVSEMQAAHNLSAQEAESLVGRNVITRALGVREAVEVDCRLVRVKPGDILLMCSDGLCGFADDDEIFEAAHRLRDDLKKMVDALVQFANDRGGNDNVTVVAMRVMEAKATDIPELPVFTLTAESREVLAAEDEWLPKIREAAEALHAGGKRQKKK